MHHECNCQEASRECWVQTLHSTGQREIFWIEECLLFRFSSLVVSMKTLREKGKWGDSKSKILLKPRGLGKFEKTVKKFYMHMQSTILMMFEVLTRLARKFKKYLYCLLYQIDKKRMSGSSINTHSVKNPDTHFLNRQKEGRL